MQNQRITIDKLLKQINNKYALVVTTSKRARLVLEEHGDEEEKPVTVAMREIAAGNITYESTREGIK